VKRFSDAEKVCFDHSGEACRYLLSALSDATNAVATSIPASLVEGILDHGPSVENANFCVTKKS
jgi:hypothetical protein